MRGFYSILAASWVFTKKGILISGAIRQRWAHKRRMNISVHASQLVGATRVVVLDNRMFNTYEFQQAIFMNGG